MDDHRLVRYDSLLPTPWKNGRGITRNVCDDVDELGEWSWRISIAEIAGEQPYSPYPGVHRDQVTLGPGGVRLSINDETHHLRPEGVISFEGEATVTALPDAANFLDLNVMTRRDAWSSETTVAPFIGKVTAEPSTLLVLLALSDSCVIDGEAAQRLDALLVSAGSCTVSGRFVAVRLTRR